MAESQTKGERIYTRVTPLEKRMIASAAKAQHQDVSAFMLESALREATNTLLDQRIFWADADAFAALEEDLARPAQAPAGLIELLSRKAPWE